MLDTQRGKKKKHHQNVDLAKVFDVCVSLIPIYHTNNRNQVDTFSGFFFPPPLLKSHHFHNHLSLLSF